MAEQFTLDRSMLRRVPLSLGAGVGTGHASRLQTNASVKSVKHVVGAKHKKIKKNRKLSCQLPVGVKTEPLYSLDSPEELNKLVGRIRTMWAKANDVTISGGMVPFGYHPPPTGPTSITDPAHARVSQTNQTV